jgi:hypothetical protein
VVNHVNPLHVILERLGSADSAKAAFFPWDEVKDWPSGALDVLVDNGLLQQAQPAAAIVCDGCEENCTMPVTVYPAQDDKPGRAFITCVERDDIGRVHVDFRRMEQWQTTGELVAAMLARLLSLSQPSNAADGGQWRIGTLKGKKHNSPVKLLAGDSLTLALAGHAAPLVDVLTIEKNSLALDKAALIRLVDNPADKSETETPEARKARLIARVNEVRAKGTRAFLQTVANEEGFDVSRLKQIIYDYPKAKSAATPMSRRLHSRGILPNRRGNSPGRS